MIDHVTLEWSDICRHEPRCMCKECFYATVPDFKTYYNATQWLRHERKYKLISAEGVRDGDNNWTGEFRFKFWCQQEYILFLLRWA